VLQLITPENLPGVLTAVFTFLGGGGILTWWRIRREPPKPGSPDAAVAALAENTRALLAMADAMKAQNTHFADNNDMFRAIGQKVDGMARDFTDMKHDASESKAHLAAMRDALNRRR
jgi:hypothetical protein